MKNINSKSVITAVVFLLLAMISFFGISRATTNIENYSNSTEQLENLKGQALGMTTTATALSTAAAAVPGEALSPIADKLIDVAGYMVIVYVAIVLEKYLLTLTGFAAFKILIPIGCLLIAAGQLFQGRKNLLYGLAIKFAALGFLMWILVPVSVGATQLINKTFEESTAVDDITLETEETTTEVSSGADAASQESSQIQENTSLKDKVGSWFSNVEETVKESVDKVSDTVSGKAEELKDALNRMIEKVAVMIVTTCGIPICVLFAFTWVFKLVTGIPMNVKMPKASRLLPKKKADM